MSIVVIQKWIMWNYSYYHHRNLLSDWGRDLHSQLPKQVNPSVKQGKHFPRVEWALDSPWAMCPSAPEAGAGSAGAPAAKQGLLALCRVRKAQQGPGRSLRHKTSQTWQVQCHKWGWQECWATAKQGPQQLPAVKMRAAGTARNSACSFLGLCTALLISSTWSAICHPSVQSWSCVPDTKGKMLILMVKMTMLKIDRFLQCILLFCLLFLRNTSIARNWGDKKLC